VDNIVKELIKYKIPQEHQATYKQAMENCLKKAGITADSLWKLVFVDLEMTQSFYVPQIDLENFPVVNPKETKPKEKHPKKNFTEKVQIYRYDLENNTAERTALPKDGVFFFRYVPMDEVPAGENKEDHDDLPMIMITTSACKAKAYDNDEMSFEDAFQTAVSEDEEIL
jgi:hypothetical protein